MAHHIGWAIHHGYWPERLDHRYGKEMGNSISNLRKATQQQNMGNIGKPKHNTSGIKGVSYHKATGKWQAQITINRRSVGLGVHSTREEAGAVYVLAAETRFGKEFARTEDFLSVPVVARGPERSAGRPAVWEVREALSYDHLTGILKWKKALSFRGPAGSEAGRVMSDGYRRIGLYGDQYQAHILAWVIVMGCWPVLSFTMRTRFGIITGGGICLK